MNLDTRSESLRLLGRVVRTPPRVVVKLLLASALALAAYHVPVLVGRPDLFEDLPHAGRLTLGVLVFAAVLWVTEAIPAFAVSVLVIGLQIAILGRPGGPMMAQDDPDGWRIFVDPWSSPLVWLFLGGFVLAQGAAATGLDRWLAMRLLRRTGGRPAALLAGCMLLTFVLSMFMSNTATATMMLAVLAPLLASRAADDRFGRGLILGVAAAANLGGMGTVIGSPPNAIAVAQLPPGDGVDFLRWMAFGLPAGLVLAALAFFYLRWRYHETLADGADARLALALPADRGDQVGGPSRWHRFVVMATFALTVAMWMTEAWHGIPAPVISFIPITAFCVTGVLTARSMRTLPWDVLLLIVGGLSLGVAVKESGLAAWLAAAIPPGWSLASIGIGMALLAALLSSFMSNTATASILLPLLAGVVAGATGDGGEMAARLIPVALVCSTAMVLPISTPPNAVAFTSGRLRTIDLMALGAVMLVAGPLVAILWSRLAAGWLL